MPRPRPILLAPLLLVLALGCREAPHARPAAHDAPAGPVAAAPDTTYAHPSAPGFTRPTLSGDAFRLSDQRGEIVVLNFWATWCGPCRVEIPDFVQLQQELEGDVQFVGVSLDEQGFTAVRPFAERMNINYPLVTATDRIARAYGGIPYLPMTFIIDQQGRVRHLLRGVTTRSRLRPVLLEMIAETP